MRYLLLFLCLNLIIAFGYTQESPLLCDFPEAHYTGQEIFPRIEWDNQSLALVSWNTAETVQTLETNFQISVFEPVDWSPSCHYLLAKIEENSLRKVIVWDAILGQRIGTLEGYANRNRITWSGSEQYLVIQLREGAYLWSLNDNRQVLLNATVDNYERSFYSVEWDEARNQVLTVAIGSGNGVKAYDLSTGNLVGFFHIGERAAPVTYRRYNNNQSIFVYTSSRENTHDGLAKGLALWDRDSQVGLQLDNHYEYFGLDSFGTFDMIGTVSSRYFVLGDYGIHFGRLYIWDLANKIGASPYIPNFQQSLHNAGDLRLLDATTLEVTDWSVWAYTYTPLRVRTSLIDLSNFSVNYQSQYRDYEFICPSPPSELLWACERANAYNYYQDLRTGENNAVYYAPR